MVVSHDVETHVGTDVSQNSDTRCFGGDTLDLVFLADVDVEASFFVEGGQDFEFSTEPPGKKFSQGGSAGSSVRFFSQGGSSPVVTLGVWVLGVEGGDAERAPDFFLLFSFTFFSPSFSTT